MLLTEHFREYIRSQSLIKSHEGIVVAVSGGADSMALLDLFIHLKSEFHLRLAVAHIHHGLRGPSADRDEMFVHAAARRYGLPCHTYRCDVQSYARHHKQSIEEAGRILRLGWMESLVDRLDFQKLALGHHADDQAETILMRLARGTGIRGLGGIRLQRGRIIHPLLFARRKEIEIYLERRSIAWMTDQSNANPVFLRNRVRRDLIGPLEAVFGGHAVDTICRTGEAVQEVDLVMEQLSIDVEKYVIHIDSPGEIILDISKFLHYFKSIRKRIVIRILETHFNRESPVTFDAIERIHTLAVRGRSGGSVILGNGVRVLRSRDTLVFYRHFDHQPRRDFVPGDTIETVPGQLLITKRVDIKFESLRCKTDGNIEFIDYDQLQCPLSVRFFQKGDWFVPLGMRGKKKLQDFFIDESVPNYRRRQIPLICNADGRIIWIGGMRIDDRFKITERTKRALKLNLIDS